MLAQQTYVFTCYSFAVLLSVYWQSLHFQISEILREIHVLLVLRALTCYCSNSQYSCVNLYIRKLFFCYALLQQSDFELNQITVFLTGHNLKKSHNVQSVAVPGWLILLEREQSRGNQSFKLFHTTDVCFMDSVIFKTKN